MKEAETVQEKKKGRKKVCVCVRERKRALSRSVNCWFTAQPGTSQKLVLHETRYNAVSITF